MLGVFPSLLSLVAPAIQGGFELLLVVAVVGYDVLEVRPRKSTVRNGGGVPPLASVLLVVEIPPRMALPFAVIGSVGSIVAV